MTEYICKEVQTDNGGYLEPVKELIRCRDCKNFHDEWGGNKWCYITKWRTNEDRFCSSAEKIED